MSERVVVKDCPVCVHVSRRQIEDDLCFNANIDCADVARKYGITQMALSPAQEEAGGSRTHHLPSAGEIVRLHRSHFTPTRPTE